MSPDVITSYHGVIWQHDATPWARVLYLQVRTYLINRVLFVSSCEEQVHQFIVPKLKRLLRRTNLLIWCECESAHRRKDGRAGLILFPRTLMSEVTNDFLWNRTTPIGILCTGTHDIMMGPVILYTHVNSSPTPTSQEQALVVKANNQSFRRFHSAISFHGCSAHVHNIFILCFTFENINFVLTDLLSNASRETHCSFNQLTRRRLMDLGQNQGKINIAETDPIEIRTNAWCVIKRWGPFSKALII